MPVFAVMLRGENFEILENETTRRFGFYATRYVHAGNESDAEKAAVEMVLNDEYLKACVKRDTKLMPRVYLESIERRSWWTMLKPPKGFSFWSMDVEERNEASNPRFDTDATRRST